MRTLGLVLLVIGLVYIYSKNKQEDKLMGYCLTKLGVTTPTNFDLETCKEIIKLKEKISKYNKNHSSTLKQLCNDGDAEYYSNNKLAAKVKNGIVYYYITNEEFDCFTEKSSQM